MIFRFIYAIERRLLGALEETLGFGGHIFWGFHFY